MQCFDLCAYLVSNFRMHAFNSRWRCPVCSLDLRPADLCIDTYVENILAATAKTLAMEVFVTADGSWRHAAATTTTAVVDTGGKPDTTVTTVDATLVDVTDATDRPEGSAARAIVDVTDATDRLVEMGPVSERTGTATMVDATDSDGAADDVASSVTTARVDPSGACCEALGSRKQTQDCDDVEVISVLGGSRASAETSPPKVYSKTLAQSQPKNKRKKGSFTCLDLLGLRESSFQGNGQDCRLDTGVSFFHVKPKSGPPVYAVHGIDKKHPQLQSAANFLRETCEVLHPDEVERKELSCADLDEWEQEVLAAIRSRVNFSNGKCVLATVRKCGTRGIGIGSNVTVLQRTSSLAIVLAVGPSLEKKSPKLQEFLSTASSQITDACMIHNCVPPPLRRHRGGISRPSDEGRSRCQQNSSHNSRASVKASLSAEGLLAIVWPSVAGATMVLRESASADASAGARVTVVLTPHAPRSAVAALPHTP